jgi:hypothetical protein
MRIPILLIAMVFCSAFTGAGAPTEAKSTIPPKSLDTQIMKFSDLHGDYVVTFGRDGNYTFTSNRENEKPETRTGVYKWRVTGARTAVLDLGEDEVYTFTFNSPTQATGRVKGDVRAYKFSFEKKS